jgi:hypothetical protein
MGKKHKVEITETAYSCPEEREFIVLFPTGTEIAIHCFPRFESEEECYPQTMEITANGRGCPSFLAEIIRANFESIITSDYIEVETDFVI